MFEIKLHNIPLINLRSEFNIYYNLFLKKEFRDYFIDTKYQPIALPHMDWGGNRDTLLTLLLQRAFSGIESYIPGAVMVEAGVRGCLEKGDGEFLGNPYKLKGGKGTVDKYYDELPSQLCKDFSLKAYDKALWDKTKNLYREIRNPIFHGKEIEGKSIDGVLQAFKHIHELYTWIDSWHNPNNIFPGFGKISSNPKWHNKND